MDENNLPKIDVTVDLTDVTKEAYTDTFKKPLKSGSGVVTTVMDFFHNTLLYPMQKYNLYANDKLNNYAHELEDRAKNIPTENLISPRVNILGPTIDNLKYNLDEEHIKEMFTNILISDMDKTKQNKVLPSYIEIVKQLSKEDAKFLELLKKNDGHFYTINLKLKEENSTGYEELDNFVIYDYVDNSFFKTLRLNKVITDNLQRLGLLEISYDFWYTHLIEKYDQLFNAVKGNYTIPSNQTINYDKGLIRPTALGENFIDICLS